MACMLFPVATNPLADLLLAAAKLIASIWFLQRDKLYETEKPYHIKFKPHGDIPVSNITHCRVDVPVRDLRPLQNDLTLEEDGMMVQHLDTKMKYEGYANPIVVQQLYLKELHHLIQDALGVKNVAIMEYLVGFVNVCSRALNNTPPQGPTTP